MPEIRFSPSVRRWCGYSPEVFLYCGTWCLRDSRGGCSFGADTVRTLPQHVINAGIVPVMSGPFQCSCALTPCSRAAHPCDADGSVQTVPPYFCAYSLAAEPTQSSRSMRPRKASSASSSCETSSAVNAAICWKLENPILRRMPSILGPTP